MKQVNSESAQAYAPDALNWIVGKDEGGVVGRMKFCRPIFRVAGRVNERLAHTIWENNKEGFHPIARKLIEKVCVCVSKYDPKLFSFYWTLTSVFRILSSADLGISTKHSLSMTYVALKEMNKCDTYRQYSTFYPQR